MGERKVLNKYFPPDFDPKKVPRMKRDPNKQIEVRMMIPFSMQCTTCGEFMYRGKKFNSRKEDCHGEDYLGIRKFRFYIKCVICSQEITFKTDPENGDYELETGAKRNSEAWTEKKKAEDENAKEREEEDKSDSMKALENRTLDSKIEMEIMDALDEIKSVNRRNEHVDTSVLLERSAARRKAEAETAAVVDSLGGAGVGVGVVDDEEALIKSINFGGPAIRRLPEGDRSGSGSDSGLEEEVQPGGGGGSGHGATESKRDNSGRGHGSLHHVGKSGVVSGGGNEGIGGGGGLLVAGLEAQARRMAAARAAGGAEIGGAVVLAKRRRREGDKKKKKKKKREKSETEAEGGGEGDGNNGGGATSMLGGLLGAYDSSGSEGGK